MRYCLTVLRLTRLAASLALVDLPGISAEEIARKAMKIAGDKDCFTNHNIRVETIQPTTKDSDKSS